MGKVKIETLENPKVLKSEFENCKCIQDFWDAGLSEEEFTDDIKIIDYDKKLTAKEWGLFDAIEDIFDIDDSLECWMENLGGIPQNVLSKLPKYLLIPAQDSEGEISGTSGTLQKTLNELFSEVREKSIQMNSNASTPSNLQGTGLIRSTVFALLRYKAL